MGFVFVMYHGCRKVEFVVDLSLAAQQSSRATLEFCLVLGSRKFALPEVGFCLET